MPFGRSRRSSRRSRFSASGRTPSHWNGVWALGTKLLTPRLSRSPGTAFFSASSRSAVASMSASSSLGSPAMP